MGDVCVLVSVHFGEGESHCYIFQPVYYNYRLFLIIRGSLSSLKIIKIKEPPTITHKLTKLKQISLKSIFRAPFTLLTIFFIVLSLHATFDIFVFESFLFELF